MSKFNSYIIGIGFNRSGIDSGELDYEINCNEFDKLSKKDLEDIKYLLICLLEKTNHKKELL